MEKEKILSTLTEKLGKTDFSQQTLGIYIDLNPVAEDAEPDDAYYEKAVSFLKGMQGQYNHDVATQVEDFKKNYNPKQKTEPAPEPKPNKEVEELRSELKALQDEVSQNKHNEAQKELLAQVKAEMKAQNAVDEYVLNKTLQGVTFDSKKSVKDLATEMLTKYDAEYKECRGNGAIPRTVNAGGGTPKNAASRFFEKKAQKEGWDKK